MNWFLHFIGVRPLVPNGAYNFWSGFGSDIGEMAIVGGLVTIVRHQNCHSKGCWRFGRHEYEMNGVKYRLCKKCHPIVNSMERPTKHHFALHHAETKK